MINGAHLIIAGTDVTDLVRDEAAWNWTLTLQQRGTQTVTLLISPSQSYAPAMGASVVVTAPYPSQDSPTNIWTGTIDTIDIDWIGNDGWHQITLTCVDLWQELDTTKIKAQKFESEGGGNVVRTLLEEVSFPIAIGEGLIEPGNTINRQFDGNTDMGSAYTELATASGFVCYIDSKDSTLNYHAKTSRPAPWEVDSSEEPLFESIKWKQTRADYRNVQSMQGPAARTLPPRIATFTGDGGTTIFTLPLPALSIISAKLSTSVAATATGTFTDVPNDGDTISIISFYSPAIAPPDYTFVTTLDNTVYGQILIGANANECAQNVVDAINGNPDQAGLTYSTPTWQNQTVYADAPSSGTFKLHARALGTDGNLIQLAASAANFSWSAGNLSGGVQNVTQQLSVVVLGSGTGDLNFTPGEVSLQLQVAPPAGSSLVVEYNSNVGINASNPSDGVLNIKSQYAIMTGRDVSTAPDGLVQVASVLAQYSQVPAQFSFSTFKPGLYPGLWLTVNISFPEGSASILNGGWLIQEVQADWVSGIENSADPNYHNFRYQVHVINSTEISNATDIFQSALNPVVPPSAPALAPPTVPPPPAGGQWVQETLTPVSAVSGTDLVVDASDNTVVTSGSYTFVSGDVGSRLNIGLTTGWTPGEYIIISVTSGAATLNNSPAAVSTTGGHWSLFNGTAYNLTWTPITSDWTHNQIVILALISGGVTHVLTPFRYAEQGFVIDPIDPTLGPDYTLSGNLVTLKASTSAGDILLAVYFPEGLAIIPSTNPHGSDLVSDGGFGDFGRKVSSDSFCFDSSAVGKILRITGGAGWSPDDYLITAVGSGGEACMAFLEFDPAPGGTTGGVWELIG
jgi:hypothetical protein